MEPSRLQPPTDVIDFNCPRCDGEVRERLYGPCEPCRGELRAAIRGEAGERTVANYEPKMNVTPNAVATKD